MASDDDYMAFLNKANNQSDAGAQASTQSSAPAKFKATDTGSEVPKAIKNACKNEVYVSDADEPFQEVSLKWDGEGGLPDEGTSTWTASFQAGQTVDCLYQDLGFYELVLTEL